MDISQLGSASLQNAQWQSLLTSLDDSDPTQTDATSIGNILTGLLQSEQSTATANGGDSTDGSNSLAMLQALQNISGTDTTDPFIQALDGTDDTDAGDPFLQAMEATDTTDPLLQASDSTDVMDGTDSIFDGNSAMMQALQTAGISSSDANSNSSSNSLAMLQALNNAEYSMPGLVT